MKPTTVFAALLALALFGSGYAQTFDKDKLDRFLDRLAEKNNGQKLVAIYPEEGTFYSDNPYLVLNAPWVSAEQKKWSAIANVV